MGKYRKKPVVIVAQEFQPHEQPWPNGVESYSAKQTETVDGTCSTWSGWRIQTLEGPMEVRPGDFIITGVKGERYPVRSDIFHQTYEPVEDEDAS